MTIMLTDIKDDDNKLIDIKFKLADECDGRTMAFVGSKIGLVQLKYVNMTTYRDEDLAMDYGLKIAFDITSDFSKSQEPINNNVVDEFTDIEDIVTNQTEPQAFRFEYRCSLVKADNLMRLVYNALLYYNVQTSLIFGKTENIDHTIHFNNQNMLQSIEKIGELRTKLIQFD